MCKAENKPAPLGELNGHVANLRAIAGEEMFADAIVILRKRMALDPEKLALMLLRVLNPDEIIGKGEEAAIRGVRGETLAGYKHRNELPQICGGIK